jgi:hypothetical protein
MLYKYIYFPPGIYLLTEYLATITFGILCILPQAAVGFVGLVPLNRLLCTAARYPVVPQETVGLVGALTVPQSRRP